jgi:hypothetical protein
MSRIPISRLMPTPGFVPEEGYDDVSPAGYTLWEVGDQTRFSIVVPDTYLTGTDFSVTILESSPCTSAGHRWELSSLLVRPGVHVTADPTLSETCSYEFQSSSEADRLTLRTMKVTGAVSKGTVNGTTVQAGDYLAFALTRVAAAQGDDPEPIKVFDLSVDAHLSSTVVSDCPGRLGRIIDTVRDLFNEATGGFISDQFILRSVNRCLQDLAQHDYWRTETSIPCHAGEYRESLLEAIPSFQTVHQVRHCDSRQPMTPLGSYVEFDQVRSACTASGIPEYYVVQNTDLLVWPPPGSASPSGFCVYHSYLPSELACTSANANPPIPKAHDMVFVYFVLRQAFLRDRHAPGADGKFQEYSQLYDRAKQALLGQGEPPTLSLRPHR